MKTRISPCYCTKLFVVANILQAKLKIWPDVSQSISLQKCIQIADYWHYFCYQMQKKKSLKKRGNCPTKKDLVSFRELNSTIFFNWFWAADHDYVHEFFPARQDFEIIGLLSVKNGLYCNLYELRSGKLIFSRDFG
jgi:hypothetical protein